MPQPKWYGRFSWELILSRYFRKFQVRDRNSCWLWIGALNGGYGYMYVPVGGKPTKVSATMVSMFVRHGKWPSKKKPNICHHCDTPRCVNPNHLYFGSQKENMADRSARGRSRALQGVAHVRAKLSEVDVRELRRLYGSDDRNKKGNLLHTYKTLAQRFGIGISQVKRIVDRESWAHID